MQQRTPATTQWPRYRKSRLFAISHRIFCVWLYFWSIRVTWFPLDYPITNIMLTRWLTLERRCCLISQKRQVGVGYWRAQSTLREHNCNCSRGFIIIIIIIIIILPFEELHSLLSYQGHFL